MTCADLVAQLSEYIDGSLAGEPRAALERHLAECDRCHIVLDSTRCTILLYRVATSPSLPDERRQALLSRLEKACRGCS
jgi:anti-sigma factor RsiW